VALFCYQAKKWIGLVRRRAGRLGYAGVRGSIGEHAPPVRARICAELGFPRHELDEPRNAGNAAVISTGRQPRRGSRHSNGRRSDECGSVRRILETESGE